ncbi:MAG: hypothetical protein HY909_13365, partial [Deltaproteobacteria bacterium]|nr:hypothetical protein [Deltaproteobacteria bacterium]
CLDAVTQATTTVTVTYQTSNTGEEQDWKDSTFSKTLVAVNTSDTPKSSFETISSLADLGAFGRFKVVSDKAIATVRLVVCGRG